MSTAIRNAHRLHELRTELQRVREEGGYGSASRGKALFDELCVEAARRGQPLTQLNTRSPDEVERFFAFTVPGPSGHVYWTGGKEFARNDGKYRIPRRWWWQHKYGNLTQWDDLRPICGDRACINPEHAEKHRREARRYTDEQMIGALQVATMRMGHAPTRREWIAAKLSPSEATIEGRFGSWGAAIRAAGLKERKRYQLASPSRAIAALRHARKLIGHWPTYPEFNKPHVRASLREAGLPSSPWAIRSHLGDWSDALHKAGKRG